MIPLTSLCLVFCLGLVSPHIFSDFGKKLAIFLKPQEVRIWGTLKCDGKPLYGQGKVLLQLVEVDIIKNDVLAEGIVPVNGTFEYAGSEWEFTKIRVFVKIYHSCGGVCRLREIKDIGRGNLGGRELLNQGEPSSKCPEGKYPDKDYD